MGDDYRETRLGGPGRPEPRTGRDLQDQIALLSAQVRRLGERISGASASREPQPATLAGDREVVDALSASILAAAENVAAEIRSSAAREAQLMRGNVERKEDVRLAGLAAMVGQHRETVSALSSEGERIERSAAALRAQIRALEGEIQAIGETIDTLLSRRD
jgi:chromosome segregation ATPase